MVKWTNLFGSRADGDSHGLRDEINSRESDVPNVKS